MAAETKFSDLINPKKNIFKKIAWRFRHTVGLRALNWQFRRILSPKRAVIFTYDGDLRLRIWPNDVIGKCLWIDGFFELEETDFVRNFVKPGMVVFDIGANCGYYALLAAKRVGAQGQVHCFEPSIRIVQELRYNLQFNGFSTVQINTMAVSEKVGIARLSRYPAGKEVYGSLGPNKWPGEKIIGYDEVTVTTIDEYIRKNEIRHVDLIKIDIEGGELATLKGAQTLMRAPDAPAILFESSISTATAFGYNPDEVFQLLRSVGYRIHALTPTGLIALPDSVSISRDSLPPGNFVAIK